MSMRSGGRIAAPLAASAGGAEQDETFAGIDLEIDRIRSDVRAEALRDPLEPDPHREPQYTPAI